MRSFFFLTAMLFTTAEIQVGVAEDEYVVEVSRDLPRLAAVDVSDFDGFHKIPIGTVQYGKKWQCILPVTNSTGLDWKIQKVSTSCGCTAGVPVSKRIRAGESSTILFSITPKRIGDLQVSAKVILENKSAADIRFALLGHSLGRFSLLDSQFDVDESENQISTEIRSNFSDFADVEAMRIQGSAFDSLKIMGEGSKVRSLVGVFSKRFLNSRQRQTNTYISVATGNSDVLLPVSIVRNNVLEMKPAVMLFEPVSGTNSVSTRCFIKGSPSSLEKIENGVTVQASVADGTDVPAELIVDRRNKNFVMCRISVASQEMREMVSKDEHATVQWKIKGVGSARTNVVLER